MICLDEVPAVVINVPISSTEKRVAGFVFGAKDKRICDPIPILSSVPSQPNSPAQGASIHAV